MLVLGLSRGNSPACPKSLPLLPKDRCHPSRVVPWPIHRHAGVAPPMPLEPMPLQPLCHRASFLVEQGLSILAKAYDHCLENAQVGTRGQGHWQATTAAVCRRMQPQAVLGGHRWGFCRVPANRVLSLRVTVRNFFPGYLPPILISEIRPITGEHGERHVSVLVY